MFWRKRKRVQPDQPASDLSARVADSVQSTFSSQSACQPLFDRGVMNFENRNYEAAIADFSVYISVAPQNVYAYIYRGRAYLELHKMPEAWRDLTQSIGVDPNCGEAYYWCGYLESYWYDTDESLRAAKKYDRALELGYRTAKIYFARAGIRTYHMKDHEGALEDYAEGLKLDPNCHEAYSSRSLVYLKLHNLSAALADINHAIELKPGVSHYRQTRAEIAYQLQEFDQVLSDCDLVIQDMPENSGSYYMRGLARRAKSDFEGALEDFRKVLTYGSSKLDAYHIRALIAEMKSKISTSK